MPKPNSDKTTESAAGQPPPLQNSDPAAPPQSGRGDYTPAQPPLWNNLITISGMLLLVLSSVLLVTFGLFHLITPTPNPYIDIAGYLVLPGLMIAGVLVIPLGILFKSWRLHRRNPAQHVVFRFPRIDLNDPQQRRAAKIATLACFLLLPVVGISSYHGYHYVDSAAFCAKACHAVMQPQATTYEHSAHARVACTECHIGSGVSWFVKSKLSGTRQALAVWRDSYSRPIAPAITDLRPARDTCEQCHWPKKFFGSQLKRIVRFASDENNTRREIDMLLKTGGGDESIGRAEGIHMHMALASQVDYIAMDEKLQVIPWVKVTDGAGRTTIYRSDGRPTSDAQPQGQLRQLDCMDCHNRPAHKFRSPQEAVDLLLSGGKLDPTLPYIKRQAVVTLARPYPDVATGKAQIGVMLAEFYQTNYPEVWKHRRAAVNYAIDQVREIYAHNFFPQMKVDWKTYPDNIGHKISPGCFRCHTSNHMNAQGKTLALSCDTCHTFLNRVDHNGDGDLIQEGQFVHSIPIGDRHTQLQCGQCHTGGNGPVPTCAGCHQAQAAFRAGTLETFKSFAIDPDPMAETVGCQECHDPSQPATIEAIESMCMDCHDDEEERFEGMLAAWRTEVDRLISAAQGAADTEGQQILDTLRRAGPLHNIAATRRILGKIAGGTDPDIAP